MSRKRDWSLLNRDLLHVISDSLSDISDRLRFRSVCSTWRSSAGPIPPHPRHLPYLLLVPWSHHSSPCHVITPLDPDRRIYSLQTPFSRGIEFASSVFGSSSGLFLVVSGDTRTISIVDPLPGGRWRTIRPEIPPVCQNGQIDVRGAKILSMEPNPFLLIIAVINFKIVPLVWRGGDNLWTRVRSAQRDAYDAALYRGNYYVVADDNRTYVVNPTSLRVSENFTCPELADREHKVAKHLVESSSGDLLLVVWNSYMSIAVFRLVGKKWEKATSIGDDTLFLDGQSAMCFPSGRFSGYMKNCVYFVPERAWAGRVDVYDLAKGEVVESKEYLSGAARAVWASNAH